MKLSEPESQVLEYKEEWSDTVKKTMIAFANDLGGVLQIGVADDGEVVGCNFDMVERAARSFARNGVEPSMSELVQVRKQNIGGKILAAVIVAPGREAPYSFKGKVFTDGGVFIRLGGQTVPASRDEVFQIIRRGDPRTWETRTTAVTELTFDDASRVFAKQNVPFSEANWLGYGIHSRDRRFTNLALLISDQCPARIILNIYDDSGAVKGSERIGGSILAQLESVQERLAVVNEPILTKKAGALARNETYPWPQFALREALVNTMAHRDYSSPLQAAVNIHTDFISFLTPGGIPSELTLEEALAEGASFCRNEKLAEIFMHLRWMEKAGTGFSDIFRDYAVFPQKPRMRHIARSFLIELPRVSFERTDNEYELLKFVRSVPQGRRRAEIEKHLGLSRPTTANLIKKLLMDGDLVRVGQGPATRYTTQPQPSICLQNKEPEGGLN